VREDLAVHGLQQIELFVSKVLQLHETMLVRHGVMMVGRTLTGKSTCFDTLQHALTALQQRDGAPASPYFQRTHQHVVNPKSVSRDELYGAVNATTREWTDGTLSKIVRHVVGEANHNHERHWIVFDGPVDAVWIENMNTVLDDNKMLCLVNGERLKMPDTVTFCFEVQDLRHASPATVSRCGMVYIEPYYLDGGWKPVLASMNAKLAAAHYGLWNAAETERILTSLIEGYLNDPASVSCCEWIPSVAAQSVQATLRLLSALLTNIDQDDDAPKPPVLPEPELNEDGIPLPTDATVLDVEPPVELPAEVKRVDAVLFKQLVLFAFVWGFGGNLCEKSDSRQRFSAIVLPRLRSLDPEFPDLESSAETVASATGARTVFDFKVHKKGMQWVPWATVVPQFVYRRSTPFFDLLVPTAETIATSFIIGTMLERKHHVLLNGTTGTGKSAGMQALIFDHLKTEDPASPWQAFGIVLSAQTSSRQLQEKFESKLRNHPSRGKHPCIGPASGKTLVAFVDDVNMPLVEEYGASPSAELLRQMIVQGGCFDRKRIAWKDIIGVVHLACCGPPGGGKNELTQRLTSRYFLLCQPALSSDSMQKIFVTILRGFFGTFSEEVRGLAADVAAASLDIYKETVQTRLPTPAKSHYTFNLRDVSRVVQGIVQSDPTVISGKADLVDLWAHETSRVFHDRLTDDSDRAWWWKAQRNVLVRRFQAETSDDAREILMYGDFGDVQDDYRRYKKMVISADLHDILTEKMLSYGIQFGRDMDLVLFDDAVRHLARICRILRQPRGHALLVGVGGSGRQSLAQLAAFITECKGFSIVVTRTYGVADFREDLRKVLLETGTENRRTALIISDTQLVKEQFLEDLNNLLNTGEVPNVYQPEDYERMMTSVRDAVLALGKPDTQNVLLAHFTSVCRNNLHVVLAMSPAGAQFRLRIRMFPSLTSCMTIDWFSPWPETALLSVAQRLLTTLDVDSEHQRAALCRLAVSIHSSVKEEADRFFLELRRHAYTTPTSYLSLLNLIVSMIQEQSARLQADVARFRGGLDKILETNRKVDEMKRQLIEMQPLLEQQSIETSRFAKQVDQEQKIASEVAVVVAEEEKACSVIMAEAASIKDDCQAELDRAMPAYHEAVDALNSLNPKDINETKSYTSPPKKVETVMGAVLTLLEEDTTWDSARKVMNKPDFINTLKNFDKDHVSDKTLRKLKKYIDMEDFKPETVQNVSKACVSFVLWCRAIDNYCEVMKVVNPKRASLVIAEEKLAVARGQLEAKQAQLRELEAKIIELRAQFEASMRRKQHLEEEMHKTQVYLSRAERLLSGLAEEYERWGRTAAMLTERMPFLAVTSVMSAAMTAYGGPFTAPFRQRLLDRWLQVAKELSLVCPPTFRLSDVIEPVVIRNWQSNGLPTDEISVENATIVAKSRRWCLCIDPQGQANAWIRRTYAEKGLKVLKTGDPNFMRTVENALRVGTPVLYENVGEAIDASLDPLLQKQVYRQGGHLMIRIRDSAIEYDPNFFFIMTTRLPNPHYLPELQIKVTLLNFTVTFKGLEDQLLGEVVRHERPDLEERSDRIIVQVADARGQLTDVEDKILMLLSSASGDLLENEVLISTLQQSKVTSHSISENLKVAEATQEEILTAREEYRAVATRGSIVFSTISDVSALEHMYQNSLVFFVKLFKQTLSRTASASTVAERCALLIDAATLNSFNGVCRGMFERHKPVFAALLAMAICRHNNEITEREMRDFVVGSQGRLPQTRLDNPVPDMLSDEKWDDFLCIAESSQAFSRICLRDGVLDDMDDWRKFIQGQRDLPRSIDSNASAFQKLIVVKCLREETLFQATRKFVQQQLGAPFIEYESFDLNASFADSSPFIPIVIVLSVGTDPTSMFTSFADSKGFGAKTHLVSMGQGQGDRAEAYINQASQAGEWVYLQNCHVYTTWMPRLEALIAETTTARPHTDYRLWLTTMPCDAFPVPVLQSSLKLTREPPKGLRANMLDTFSNVIDEVKWQSCPSQTVAWRRLLFATALFHCLAQERRKFGALGWNIRYDWNTGDLDASLTAIHAYVERLAPSDAAADSLPWDAINYMIGDICYGGRVTDDWDQCCLRVLMRRIIQPDVLKAESEYRFNNDADFILPDVANSTVADICRFVSALPDEKPSMFGLHSNAAISFDAQSSKQLHAWIVEVQPRTSSASSSSVDVVANTVADLRARLPLAINRAVSHPDTYRITESGVMTSLGTVCQQEVDCCNRLINYVSTSLTALDAAMRGEVVMDSALENVCASIQFMQVPKVWEKAGYPSLRPLLSWFADFIRRVEFFRDWNDTGVPTSCWLGAFFFPQGFLTGVLQTHSRQYKVPIDKLRFAVHPFTEVDPDATELPLINTGIYVHGLWFEGARWDNRHASLAEARARELFSPMPVMHFEPVTDPIDQHADEQGKTMYDCPIYKIATRAGVLSTTGISSNFVLSVRLSTGEQTADHWTLRGTALITSLSE
jgi:dynein heavy chain